MEWLSSLEQTEAEKSVFSLGRGSNNTTNNNNKNNSHVSEEDLGHFDAKSESHFGDDEHLDANKYYNSEKSGFLRTSKYKNNIILIKTIRRHITNRIQAFLWEC